MRIVPTETMKQAIEAIARKEAKRPEQIDFRKWLVDRFNEHGSVYAVWRILDTDYGIHFSYNTVRVWYMQLRINIERPKAVVVEE